MTTVATPPPYTANARCRSLTEEDADLFFPATGRHNAKQRRDAKVVCNGRTGQAPCVVRESCGLWAIALGEDDGIWGGMTPRERRQFRKGTTSCPLARRRRS